MLRTRQGNRKTKQHNTTRPKQLFFIEKLAASCGTCIPVYVMNVVSTGWGSYGQRKFALLTNLCLLQMRKGFTRLQATWRARRLSRQFRQTRRRVMGFQRYCRGYIARRRFRRRLFSIIKLQSLFRMIMAKRRVSLGVDLHDIIITSLRHHYVEKN